MQELLDRRAARGGNPLTEQEQQLAYQKLTNREAGSEGPATKFIKEFQTYIGNRGGRSDEEELDALLDDIGIEGLGEREAPSESPAASALSVSAPRAPTLATREEYNTCFDLLGWWRSQQKQQRHGVLCDIARFFLPYWMSEAPVESCFSFGGMVASKRRCAMLSENVDRMLTLGINLRLHDKAFDTRRKHNLGEGWTAKQVQRAFQSDQEKQGRKIMRQVYEQQLEKAEEGEKQAIATQMVSSGLVAAQQAQAEQLAGLPQPKRKRGETTETGSEAAASSSSSSSRGRPLAGLDVPPPGFANDNLEHGDVIEVQYKSSSGIDQSGKLKAWVAPQTKLPIEDAEEGSQEAGGILQIRWMEGIVNGKNMATYQDCDNRGSYISMREVAWWKVVQREAARPPKPAPIRSGPSAPVRTQSGGAKAKGRPPAKR